MNEEESGPSPLTQEEISEGWHFCYEWDGLLVGPGMDELEPCHCLPEEHTVYKPLNRRTQGEAT